MERTTLIFLLCIALANCATTKKKTTEETVESTDAPGPAILAIEIVDGNSNDTTSELRNNTKRTIESALGYGFQGNYFPTSQGKKYMIYPYSQRDIPPSSHKLDSTKYLTSQQTLNIQKSVSYNLGTTVEPAVVTKTQAPVYVQPNVGYYPSTLFSTVGHGGVIGGLSTNFPSQQQTTSASVPVIILRVYTNQLADSTIYPNLPQTHPYANNLNSINLQSILSNYLQQQYYQQQQAYKTPIYATQNTVYPGHQSQNLGYQGQAVTYQSQNVAYQPVYQNQVAYKHQEQPQAQIDYKALEASAASLPTHENYPSPDHTRVIYHGPKGHIQSVSYSSANQAYAAPASHSQAQSYAPKQQYVYTDSHGQSYIYVNPSQLQGQSYYKQQYQPQSYQEQEYQPQTYQQQEYQQQEYQQPEYQQQDYQQQDYQQQGYQQQDYQQQGYQQQDEQNYQSAYQDDSKNRQYLPVAQTEATPTKLYNYHAHAGKDTKDRSKKSSGAPITFESQEKGSKPKRNQ